MTERNGKGYTYEQLLNTNVRAIWVYAGTLGISSPSTMKKEDLIRLILEVQEGNVKIEPRRKKGPGRPRKNAGIEEVNDKDEMSVASPTANGQNMPEREYEFEGVYCGDKSGGFLCDEQYASTGVAPYIFPKLATTVSGMKDGDIVKAKVVKFDGNSVPVVVGILEINGEKPESRATVEYREAPQKLSPEKMMADNGDTLSLIADTFVPLYKGARGVIFSDGDETGLTTAGISMIRGIKKNNPSVKIIVALLSGRGEEYDYIRKNVDCECYYSSMQLGQKNNMYTAKIAFGRAKNLSLAGEDVVVLVDSLNECYKAISKGNKTFSPDETIDEIIKYFGYARNCEEGSVTVIGTLKKTDDDKELVKRVTSVCGWKLVLSKYLASMRVFPAIDLAESYSKKEEELMDERVYRVAKDLRKKIIKGLVDGDAVIEEMKEAVGEEDLLKIAETL